MKFRKAGWSALILLSGFTLSACGGGGSNGTAGTSGTAATDLVYLADNTADNVYELFATSQNGVNTTTLTQNSLAQGVDRDFEFSPDGRYVAFLRQKDTPGVTELYVDDLDNTAPPVKVNGVLIANGNVTSFQWSPDSSRLAYVADQNIDLVYELYTVAPDGSQLVRVSGDMVVNGSLATDASLDTPEYAWSPDGQRLAYIADQDTNSVGELYTVLANGTSNIRINGNLVANGDVVGFKWSPDSQRVMYRADQDTNTVYELYSTLAIGLVNGKLNATPVAGGDVSARYGWSYDSQSVAFIGDLDTDNKYELYTSGFLGANKLKVSLPAIDVVDDMAWLPPGSRLIYRAVAGTRSDLYAVNADGSKHIQLNDPLSPADTQVLAVNSAPDGSRIAFITESNSGNDFDLFSVTASGLTRNQINVPGVPQGEIGSFAWSPDSQSLAYRADQEVLGQSELYTTDFDGQNHTKVSGTLVTNGDVKRYKWSPDSQSLAYIADQDINNVDELYTVDKDGLDLTRISVTLLPTADVDTFKWRP